jgi:hypothetical protein
MIFGAALFFAGFFLNKYLAGTAVPDREPTYVEHLTRLLDLTDDQKDEIRRLLDEEDREIKAVLTGELGLRMKSEINGIRTGTHESIVLLLDDRQKELFHGAGIENSPDYNR